MSRRAIVSVLGAASLLAALVAGSSSASATGVTRGATAPAGTSGALAATAAGTYFSLATPTRFLDTRTMGTKAPLAAGSTTTVPITGRSGIPSTGVSAVVLNLTAVTTTSQGYFTVYPSGVSRPTASSINFPAGWTGANMVTVPVGSADGAIKLYNYGGKAHAIVDVLGWYAKDDTGVGSGPGAQFLSTSTGDPERIFDSRAEQPFAGGEYIDFQDSWATEAAARAVRAYAVTITAVNATSSGVFTTWAGGDQPKPTASTVNYEKGVIAPNMAIVPARYYTSLDPRDNTTVLQNSGWRIQNTGSGQVDMVVDVTGYYTSDGGEGLRFRPLTGTTPKRVLDTRYGTGLSGAFGANTSRDAPATSIGTASSYYVVGNTTGVKPTVRTYLTVWSGERARPSASNLNVMAGLVRSVSTYAPLKSASGALTYRIYNNAGSMHVVYDAVGTLDLYTPPVASPAVAGARAAGATVSPVTTTHRRG